MVHYSGKVDLRWLTTGFWLTSGKGQMTMATAPEVMEPEVGDDVGDEVATDVGGESKGRGRRKAEDDPRLAFEFPSDMLDDKGKITKWNSDCGYEFGSGDDGNRPVKRDECASDEAFSDYRIAIKRDKIKQLESEIESMKRVRDQTACIENPVTREVAKRALMLHRRMAKDMKALAAAGVDVDELLKQSV